MATLKPRQTNGCAAYLRRGLRLGTLAVAVATMVGGVALRPAWADEGGRRWGDERYAAYGPGWREHGWREREWREREWREREWREQAWRMHHRYVYAAPGYFYSAPGYVYAPPPVVYAPQPEPPSINFVIPLGRHW